MLGKGRRQLEKLHKGHSMKKIVFKTAAPEPENFIRFNKLR